MSVRPSARLLWGRPARIVLVLAVLLPPWPPLGRGYRAVVAALAGATLGPAAAPVKMRFLSPEEASLPANPWQLIVHAEDASGRYVGTALDLRRSGYIASALFAALALTTRLPSRRRLGLLAAGLGLLQLLPLIALLAFFSGTLPVQAFHFSAPGRAAIQLGYHALIAPPGMSYALPALLWLLLAWLLDRPAAAPPAGRRPTAY